MPLIPFRGLGTRGIVKDLPPADLPLDAFSGGNNVRFNNGASMRAPGWRSSNTGLAFTPMGTFRYAPPQTAEVTFIPTNTGKVWSRSPGGSLTDVSVSGHVDASAATQFTGTYLGGVYYLNRESQVPIYYGPGSSLFANIPAWNSGHRAEVFRAYKDFLVAFGVTKGAATFPSMVKWSDAALAGAPPQSWDETDPTKLAGETILSEMEGGIIDAHTLRDAMVIYSNREVWLMEFVGGQFIFRFRKIFGDGGAINRNCAVEVQGKHYVFGTDDIYVHDGVQSQSIAEGRVRDFVFQNIDLTLTNRCFVLHNVNSKEILFCYVSGDADVHAPWVGGDGVNRAVVYCYANDTWGIMDLPNIVGPISVSPASLSVTYDNVSSVYSDAGGAYQDMTSGTRILPLAAVRSIGSAIPSHRLSILDSLEVGSLSQYALDPALFTEAYLERTHIDLDATGAPLTMFKTVDRIVPQIRVPSQVPVTFRFGANDIHGQAPLWDPALTFDPGTEYHVDTRMSGRYLAIRATMPTANDFAFSGFDAEIKPNGNR